MTKLTRIEVVANKIRLSYDPVRGFLYSYEDIARQIDDYYCRISGVPGVEVDVLAKREAGWRRLNTAVTEITKGD